MHEDFSKQAVAILRQHYPTLQGVYLFGSFGTPYVRPDSDIDLAILLHHIQAKNEGSLMLSACRTQLEECFKRPVDLLNLRLLSTVFQKQIIDEGRLNEERRGILEDFLRTGKAHNV